ncbi:MAG: autotransporter outer membrane beta-barrel domain-containing protein [Phascolarctobacterium faecium]
MVEYGIGIDYQQVKQHFYFDIERSTGSDFKKDWQWNVGAR